MTCANLEKPKMSHTQSEFRKDEKAVDDGDEKGGDDKTRSDESGGPDNSAQGKPQGNMGGFGHILCERDIRARIFVALNNQHRTYSDVTAVGDGSGDLCFLKQYTTDFGIDRDYGHCDPILEEFLYIKKIIELNDDEILRHMPTCALVYLDNFETDYGILMKNGGIQINLILGMTKNLEHLIINYLKNLFKRKNIEHYDLAPRNVLLKPDVFASMILNCNGNENEILMKLVPHLTVPRLVSY